MSNFIVGFIVGAIVATLGLTQLVHLGDQALTITLHTVSHLTR